MPHGALLSLGRRGALRQEFCAAINAYDADVHGSQCPVCSGREKPLITCSACGAGFHAACLALDAVPRVCSAHQVMSHADPWQQVPTLFAVGITWRQCCAEKLDQHLNSKQSLYPTCVLHGMAQPRETPYVLPNLRECALPHRASGCAPRACTRAMRRRHRP